MFREFVIGKQRSERQHDERVTHAWITAMLPHQKNPPSLASLLTSAKRPLTPEQQKTQFYMVVGQFQGKTRKTTLRKQVDANGRTVYVERRGK